ncbi:sensor histidine kinase [Clostridium neonatale]|uniref:sensor histidine kinase n=1 Tax=Clostridium neonatale TaxID=137838 RepID=UPI00374F2DE8
MAIKLKNRNNTEIIKNNSNKKNININIIAIILLVIISGGIMLFYPKLKECAKMDKTQIYEDNYFLDKIYDSSYMLYKDVLEHKKGSEISIEEAYIKEYLVDDYYQDNYYGTGSFSDESNYEDGNREITKSEVNISLDKEIEADKKNIVRNLDENYLQNKRTLQNDLRNVQYAVFDNDNNLIASNVEQDLLNIDNIKEKYDFYVELAFNKNGLADILKSHGIDEDLLSNRMSNYNYNKNETYQYNYTKASLNSISDCKFIYAIPKELKYVDYITELRTSYNEGVDQNVIMAFVGSVFVVILIVSFFLPYNKGKNIVGIRFINKIPTEINIVIYICLDLSIAALCLLGLQSTLDGNAIKALNNLRLGTGYSNTILFIANIFMWSISIYSIFSGVMLLKYIFTTGLKTYLKENMLLCKLYRFFVRKINNIRNELYHLDLKDKSNKMIIKIILINFLILSLISAIWIFGIGAAAIYSIVLFFIVTKYVDDIKIKFSKLLDSTNKIAEGNLGIEIDEDLGIFNPVKEAILNIKKGFKNAVDEEVKSQRMKTELISNVSHDLKTPLTSIITYVDLLKNPEITEEERKSYIDTLDKKSQRLKFLIEDLFEVSKATSGNIKLNLVKVDIVELMRQTQIELQDKLKNSKLVVRNDYPENKIILNLDSQKTYRVFENLLNNVAKYAMENSRVYINIVDNIDTAEITIRNMSANEINFTPDEIVERFQRGDKSRNTEGSGLGLAIAKSFVEAQGGNFNIEIDGDLFKVIITFKK